MEAWASYCFRERNIVPLRAWSLRVVETAARARRLNPDFLNADSHTGGRGRPPTEDDMSVGKTTLRWSNFMRSCVLLQKSLHLWKNPWVDPDAPDAIVQFAAALLLAIPSLLAGVNVQSPTKRAVSRLGRPVSAMSCTGTLIRPWLT